MKTILNNDKEKFRTLFEEPVTFLIKRFLYSSLPSPELH